MSNENRDKLVEGILFYKEEIKMSNRKRDRLIEGI